MTSLKWLWEVIWCFLALLIFLRVTLLICVDAPLYNARHITTSSNVNCWGISASGKEQNRRGHIEEHRLKVSNATSRSQRLWWHSKCDSSVHSTYCSSENPKRHSALLHYPESREKRGCDIYSVHLCIVRTCRQCILLVIQIYNNGTLIYLPLHCLTRKPTEELGEFGLWSVAQ